MICDVVLFLVFKRVLRGGKRLFLEQIGFYLNEKFS